MKTKTIFSVAAVTLLLAACGGQAPSQKEVREMAIAEFDEFSQGASLFVPPEKLRQARQIIADLTVGSCEETTKSRYDSAVYCKVTITNPEDKETDTRNVLFAKLNKQWIAPEGIIK